MADTKSGNGPVEPERTRRGPVFGRIIVSVFVLVFVFTLGYGVGQGRFGLPNHNSENKQLPESLDYTTVNQVYKSLKANYDGKLTESQLIDGLKHGLAEATGDPYTVYFTAKEAETFQNELNNSFSGIGAELGKDKDGNLVIIAPIADTPADKAGLKAQDIITAVNGEPTAGMSVDDAVTKIRGKSGTKVTLQIVRNHARQLNISIVRGTIQVPSVTTKILDGNIGYVQISTFADDTADLIQSAATKLKQAHVNGIILDLRDNPGGLLDAAVAVSSEWLDQGQTVVEEKGTIGDDVHTALGSDALHGIKTVVLINGGSASASEITAGALHDNHDAYLIGEKSYGKGVVQQLINFGDGSELKVTVASWYRPNGQNINHRGITPDKVVKLTDADIKAGNDVQLKAAEAYLAP